MSFLDIDDPAERAKEYVTAMKTVKQRNMANRELKLAIVDELQTLFHPIVNATKQAAEETRKELEPMKKTLTDIDGALNRVDAAPQPGINVDNTFGIYMRRDGQLALRNRIVLVDENKKILSVDGTDYDLTPGLQVFILEKPQWTSHDYRVYKSLFAQTKVRWKYKHMHRRISVPGESIPEEGSEDTEDTDNALRGDIGESSLSILSDSSILSPGLPSPAHTRYGKAKKTKDRVPFYKGFKSEGVVYLPGDINGIAKKLQILAAEFFVGNSTVRNELVDVLDALLRFKQLTRKEYTNITARLAASL